MTITDRDLATLAALQAGRYPRWTNTSAQRNGQDCVAVNGSPVGYPSRGVDVSGASLVVLAVDCADGRAAVSINTVADATDYTVELVSGGTTNPSYTSGADATLAEILAGLKAAIEAEDTSVTVTTADLDGDGTSDGLVITPSSGVTLGLTVTAGDMTATLAATTANFRVWAIPYGQTAWRVVNQSVIEDNAAPWVENLVAAPLSRLFIEVTSTDGLVSWGVGICQAEAA